MQTETILITGGATRIGRAMAFDLAARGARVVVHYNTSQDAAKALVAGITASGGSAAIIDADLSDLDAVTTLITRAEEAIGNPITTLINNAARFTHDTLQTATAETWADNMAPNLRAPFFLMQAFSRRLPDGQQGNIINMLDQIVLSPSPDFTSYTLSKVALWSLTRTLAVELAPRIRVNGIGPGPTLQSIHQSEAEFAAERASTPLGLGPELSDFAAAVAFILDSPALTGQILTLDGGQHLMN